MSTALAFGLAAIGIILLFLIYEARAYTKFRGARVVICPETRAAAGVEMDAWHAAATGFYRAPELRLQSCSRWPERAACGQECLGQIEAAPEGCLVRSVLARWYAGKNCAFCNEPFAEIQWVDHKPALMEPDGTTREWGGVRAEEIFAILDTHRPVCWRCHIVQTFCRENPGLVLNRSRVWPPAA